MVALPDPYGTDVLLTDQGDLAVNAAGQLELLSGPLVCAQQLIMRLRTWPGELPLQPDYGNPLDQGVIGSKANDPQLVVSKVNVELRQILTEDARFLRAQDIVAATSPDDPTTSTVSLSLVLVGGDTLSIDDVTGDASLSDFQTDPLLADNLGDDTLPDFVDDPDDPDDTLPTLDEELADDELNPGAETDMEA